jgi:hypothetical protein
MPTYAALGLIKKHEIGPKSMNFWFEPHEKFKCGGWVANERLVVLRIIRLNEKVKDLKSPISHLN